jgi:hypothetical protein
MTTALDLLSMDRFELSLQLAGAVPHFPALDLMKGLADASGATSSTPSLFGTGHALAGREVLESCQLHLKLRFFGASVPMKNLEDDGRSIVNLDAGRFSNVSHLCGG